MIVIATGKTGDFGVMGLRTTTIKKFLADDWS